MKILGFKHNLAETKITILGANFSIKHHHEKRVAQNYTQKLAELKRIYGKRKIKVGFLVNEPSKWAYQSLYEELEKSDEFEPIVLVTQILLTHNGRKNFYATIEDCYNFFKSQNMRVSYVYDIAKKKYTPASDFGVDILFYQQPWELDDVQHPVIASQTALTCYISYGLHLTEFYGDYMEQFHSLLWLMLVENKNLIKQFSQMLQHDVTNCTAVGYPKLDAYFCKSDTKHFPSDKPIVIYAPHHSFEANGLRCATFQENGKDILALAQKTKDRINWVFKPHPRFKTSVVNNGIMSEAEIDAYYTKWEKLGLIYESGDYFGLFKQSAAMITDCISFLGEYLPSGHPLFHLLSDKRPFNDFAKEFLDAYYQIEDKKQIVSLFEQVVLNRQDSMKDLRLAKIPVLFDKDRRAVTKIMAELKNRLQS